MATTNDAIILDGLMTRLSTLVLASPLTVAYPMVDFDPPEDGYLRASFQPNTTNQITLGTNGQNRHMGLLQIDVMLPSAQGGIKPMDVVGEVVAHFKRGTTITQDGLEIRIIEPPDVVAPIEGEPHTQWPIVIQYQCDANNPA